MPGLRCIVKLGSLDRPISIRHVIDSRIRKDSVRTAIEVYLEKTGVLLSRPSPAEWFIWIHGSSTVAEPPSRFAARCSDPPPSNAPDDGYQPWNWYICALIKERRGEKWQAEGYSFVHDKELLP